MTSQKWNTYVENMKYVLKLNDWKDFLWQIKYHHSFHISCILRLLWFALKRFTKSIWLHQCINKLDSAYTFCYLWWLDVTLVAPTCQQKNCLWRLDVLTKTQDARASKESGSAIAVQERFCMPESSDSCDVVVAWGVGVRPGWPIGWPRFSVRWPRPATPRHRHCVRVSTTLSFLHQPLKTIE